MGSKSNYLEEKVLQLLLGSNAYSIPATYYIGLWTSELDDTSDGDTAGEVSGNGYGRLAIDNDNTSWSGSGNSRTNAIAFEFSPATGGGWGEITHVALLDATTSGNILFWDELPVAKDVGVGDTVRFTASTFTITEN